MSAQPDDAPVAWQLLRDDGAPADWIRLTPPLPDQPEKWRELYAASRIERDAATIAAQAKVIAAADALSAKLAAIHLDPKYVGVWTFMMVHGAPYSGPTYEAELAALNVARAAIPSPDGAAG